MLSLLTDVSRLQEELRCLLMGLYPWGAQESLVCPLEGDAVLPGRRGSDFLNVDSTEKLCQHQSAHWAGKPAGQALGSPEEGGADVGWWARCLLPCSV